MNIESRTLRQQDIEQAYQLDKKWFGNHGISKADLSKIIEENPQNTLALVKRDTLFGFAVFEILENRMPKDYVGNAKNSKRTLFIQQFTTSTNYSVSNSESDLYLLEAVEEKAKELGCSAIWEALSINHPYKKENNSNFDAFGFYELHGYVVNYQAQIIWQPSETISIPCYVFMKLLE